MAVIPANKAQAQRNSDTQENEQKKGGDFEKQGKPVDIFTEKGLFEGDVVELDPTEDAWERSAPPKRGLYELKLFLPKKDSVLLRQSDNNADYKWYEISIEAKIINSENGEFDNITVFPRVSTAIGRGKNISTAAGLVTRLGFTLPREGKLSQLDVAKIVVNILKKEPTAKVLLDWSGWSARDKVVVNKSMTDFPVGEDNEYQHSYDRTAKDNSTETITASLKVRHWCQKRKDGGWDTEGLEVVGENKEAAKVKVQTISATTKAKPVAKTQPVQQTFEEVVDTGDEQVVSDDLLIE